MPARKKIVIDGIAFNAAEPTTVPVERLYSWVIWQFPRARAGGFSGAVHPPDPDYGWYPAIVNVESGHVLVYGHVEEGYPTPESAAKAVDQARK
jgi:hypothetical protein